MSDSAGIRIIPGRRRRRIPPLRRGVYLLPNLFTSAGLISGFYSVIATLGHRYELAAIMILVAQACDVLDGRIARLTRSSSSFGEQYDSLADLVAFGVAPGILVYQWALVPWGRWGWLAATLYVTCGALRLARFNVQVGSVEKRHFVGLPIPAAALEHNGVALVVERRLVGEGRSELAIRVLHAFHGAAHRVSIHVHVERRHEDADAGGGRSEEPILALRHDGDHPSVGRRDDTVLARRRRALGIAKEIEAQGEADDERHDGRRVPGGGTDHGDEPEDARRHRDHRPAFARDRQDAAHLLNCASGRRGGWTRARASGS